jgi:Na+-translocating ferredoxin:NAD+ oxidoreductase RnfC subunit
MNAQEWIEKHTDKDGYGYNFEDCNYESLTDIIQCGMLNLCGCGMPFDNIQYIRKGLEHLLWRSQNYNLKNDEQASWEQIKEKEKEVFGNEQSAYFFYYWASKEDYTEHGGSVPGWVSEKGKFLVELIKAAEVEGDPV